MTDEMRQRARQAHDAAMEGGTLYDCLDAALEAALAEVPGPSRIEQWTAWRARAEAAEAKLAKVRAAAQFWAKSAADECYADGARVAWQSCAIEVAGILGEAP